MSEVTNYNDGDIVWVKLGNNWWPGEVIADEARLPDDVGLMKKKPFCVVKFFQEDAYEYAKNPKQVFPFQCSKKEEFIKKGLARYNAKNACMEKFPEDVKHAENLTKPQQSFITTKIINNRSDGISKSICNKMYLIRNSIDHNESAQHGMHSNISSTSNGNGDEKDISNQSILRRDSVTTILNITPNRASLGSAAATPISTPPRASATASRTLSTSSSASVTPNSAAASSSCPYRCNMCDFRTSRQNVLIMHRKSHSSSGAGGGGVSTNAAVPTKSLGISKAQPSGSLIVTSTSGEASSKKEKNDTPQSRRSTAAPVITKQTEKSKKNSIGKALKNVDVSPVEEKSDSPTVELSIEKRSRRKANTSPAVARVAKTSPNTTSKRSTRTSRSTPQLAVVSPALEDVSSSDVSSTKTLITVVPADSEKNSTDDTDVNSEHSEQIRQRLLADWSDEDKDEEHTHLKRSSRGKSQQPVTPLPSLSAGAGFQLPTSTSKTTQLRRRSPTIVPLKTLEGAGQTLVMTTTISPSAVIKTAPQRIRNIPKKDRLREFEKSLTIDDDQVIADSKSTSAPVVGLESESKAGSVNSAIIVEEVTPTITTETKTVVVETANVPSTATESLSCFDFQEDEEGPENDVLKSIANFKKKYCSPEKDKTQQSNSNNDQSSPGKSNVGLEIEQRDIELSTEIDNLLEQTTAVSVLKDEGIGTVSVKGLPIKERGKRIFKSRNRSRVEDEDVVPQIESTNEVVMAEPIPTDVVDKTKDECNTEPIEETIRTTPTERRTRGGKSKRQSGKESIASSSNLSSSPVNGKADKSAVVNPVAPTSIDTQVLESITESAVVPQRSKRKPYNRQIMCQLIEDEEASIPLISHSPVELFNCESALDNSIGARMATGGRRSKTATPNSVLASREENQNGGSRASSRSLNAPTEDSSSFGVSDAGAEFGSPASSLDEERVMTPRSDSQKSIIAARGDETNIQLENESFANDDDDEIESPPHEALSGNELDNLTEKLNNKKTKTPKKKANTKENTKQAEQKTVPLLIGRRKLRAETESPISDDLSRMDSPKISKQRSGTVVGEVNDITIATQPSIESIGKAEDATTNSPRISNRKLIVANEKTLLEKTKKPKTPKKDDLKSADSIEGDETNASAIVDSVTDNTKSSALTESIRKSPQCKFSTVKSKLSTKNTGIEITSKAEENKTNLATPNTNEEHLETISRTTTEVQEQKMSENVCETEAKTNSFATALETDLKVVDSAKALALPENTSIQPIAEDIKSDSNKLENRSSMPPLEPETKNVQADESKIIFDHEKKEVQDKTSHSEKETDNKNISPSAELRETIIETKSEILEKNSAITKEEHIKADSLVAEDSKEQKVEISTIKKLGTPAERAPNTSPSKRSKELTQKKHIENSNFKAKTDTSTDVIVTKEVLKDSSKTTATDAVNSNALLTSTGVETVEKVRINVDVAHPLSSQIANILASSGSNSQSQQHQIATANRIKSPKLKTTSALLKRKHSQEEISSNDGDDVVAHVQSLCPQVKITRKERIMEPSLSPKMSDSACDINQMSILLTNEQISPHKTETPIGFTNLWQTDILQSPLTTTKEDDDRQMTPQKKISFDPRGQKYVMLGESSPTVPTTTTTEEKTKTVLSPQTITSDARSPSVHGSSPTLLQRSSQSPSPQKSPAGSTGGRKQAGNTITIPSSLTIKQQQHKFAEALALADSVIGPSLKPSKRRSSQSIPPISSGANGSGSNASRRLSSTAAINVHSPPLAKIAKTLSTEERLKSSPSKSDSSCSSKSWSLSHRHSQKQRKVNPANGGDCDNNATDNSDESVLETTATTSTTTTTTPTPLQTPPGSTTSSTKVVPTEDNQMVVEADQLNGTAKITAVPIQPIPGYAETFLLCMLVNNMYKPINNIPHYLNTDLNQLVPVPPEAYEGMLPELIVDQPPSASGDTENDNATAQSGVTAAASGGPSVEAGNKFIMTARDGDETMDESDLKIQLQNTEAALAGNDAITVESDPADGSTEPSTDNAIVLNLNDQQIILDASTFEQLLANPDGNTQLVTDDGTEFVLTREVLAALKAQHDEQNVELLAIPAEQVADSETGASADLLSVALAGSEFYGNDVLQIETTLGGAGAGGLQLLASDGSIVFQAPPLPQAHLTPPITAHTSETNAVLNQTPIMSTLEKPSTGVVAGKGGIVSSSASVVSSVEGNITGMRPNLEDSLAVIGVTAQSSTVPSSLELPITITNPAIAPKVTMATSAHGADLVQFQPHRSVSTASVVAVVAAGSAAAGVSHIYDDSME